MDYRLYHLQLQKKIGERTHISGYDIFLDLRDIRETMIEPEIVPPVHYGDFWEEFSEGLEIPMKDRIGTIVGIFDKTIPCHETLKHADSLKGLEDARVSAAELSIQLSPFEALLAAYGHKYISSAQFSWLRDNLSKEYLNQVFD